MVLQQHRAAAPSVVSTPETLALWMEQSSARMHRGLLVVREELLQCVQAAAHEHVASAALLQAKLQSSVEAWADECAAMAERVHDARASAVLQADERSRQVLGLISNISEEAILAAESAKQRCMMEALDDRAMALRAHVQDQLLQAERAQSAGIAQRLELEQQRLREGWLQLQHAAQDLVAQKAAVAERVQQVDKTCRAFVREQSVGGQCPLLDISSAITRLHVNGHGWIEDVDRQRRLVAVSGTLLSGVIILLTSTETDKLKAAGCGLSVVAEGPMLAGPVRGVVDSGRLILPDLKLIDGVQGAMDLFVSVFPIPNQPSEVFRFATPALPMLFRIPLRVVSMPSVSLQHVRDDDDGGAVVDPTIVAFDLSSQSPCSAAQAAYHQQWTLTALVVDRRGHHHGDVVASAPQAWAPVALESSDDGQTTLSVVFDVSSSSSAGQKSNDGLTCESPPMCFALSLKLAGVAQPMVVWEGRIDGPLSEQRSDAPSVGPMASGVVAPHQDPPRVDHPSEPMPEPNASVVSVCGQTSIEATAPYRVIPNEFHNTQIAQHVMTGALYEMPPTATTITLTDEVVVETGVRLPMTCTGPVCVWLPDGSEVVCLVMATSDCYHAATHAAGGGGGGGVSDKSAADKRRAGEDTADIVVYSLDEREVVASLYMPPALPTTTTTASTAVASANHEADAAKDEIKRFLVPAVPSTDLLAVSDTTVYRIHVGELWAMDVVYGCGSSDKDAAQAVGGDGGGAGVVTISNITVLDAESIAVTLSNGHTQEISVRGA